MLVAGGSNFHLPASPISAELYDSSTRSFRATRGPITVQRSLHTATLLPTGKVLLAGGALGNSISLASAELYEPSAEKFTATRSDEIRSSLPAIIV